jgi:hypothetical protein
MCSIIPHLPLNTERLYPLSRSSSHGQRTSGHLAGPGRSRTQSRGSRANNVGPTLTKQTAAERGGYGPAFKLPPHREGCEDTSQGQNRTREIRPSGIVGGPMETWTMVGATRARTAERPTQPSFDLTSRAPWFYPDPHHSRPLFRTTEDPNWNHVALEDTILDEVAPIVEIQSAIPQ